MIYSYREGAGVGQHPNGNRGASSVNFATGGAEGKCNDDDNFESLHGALMLIAWMFLAPAGIYYIRWACCSVCRISEGRSIQTKTADIRYAI